MRRARGSGYLFRRLLGVLVVLSATAVFTSTQPSIGAAATAITAWPTLAGNAAATAGPEASGGPSAAATLPPAIGAPGTTSAGTAIRGIVGVLIGLAIVVFGWRRRRRPSAPPHRLQRP